MVKNLRNYAENETQLIKDYVEIRNAKMYYEVSGNPAGDWLIMLHGFSASTKSWKKQLDEFNKHFRILNFDLIGHGNSDPLDCERYNSALVANHLRILMDELGIQKAHICGISLGTTVQQYFSQMFPERILSLIYTSPVGTPNLLSKFCQTVAGKTFLKLCSKNTFIKIFANLMLPGDANMKSRKYFIQEGVKLDEKEFRKWTKVATQGDHSLHLTKSDIPTLIVAGGKDITYFNDAVKLQDKYTNCEFKVIKNAGHVLIYQEPYYFNELVIDYINRYYAARTTESEQITIAA